MKPKRIERKLVYKSHIIDCYKDTLKTDKGNEVQYDFIDHQNAAAIVPVDKEGKIILVKQYRNAVDDYLLEIPAGLLEENEDPKDCAIRECEEETGYKATNAEHLIDVYVSPGFCNEMISIYYSKDLTVTRQNLDENEAITLEKYPLDEVLHLINTGLIKDAKTVAGILAYDRLRNK